MHEGKPYDFDFNFCCSHRLVCTEVIYRAYEGVGGVQFDLQRHVGRFALAAGDILRMALARRHFEVLYVYSPAHSPKIETGPAAVEIVRQVERRGLQIASIVCLRPGTRHCNICEPNRESTLAEGTRHAFSASDVRARFSRSTWPATQYSQVTVETPGIGSNQYPSRLSQSTGPSANAITFSAICMLCSGTDFQKRTRRIG